MIQIHPFLKDIFIELSYRAGFFAMHRNYRKKQKRLNSTFAIIMYHRISNISPQQVSKYLFSEFDIGVSQKNFEQQIYHLHKHYTVLSISEILSYISTKKPFPSNTVVITFDDGYKDIYLYAYPILRQYDVPATVFLVPNMIERFQLFWWDEITEIIRNTSIAELDHIELQEILNNKTLFHTPISLKSAREKLYLIEVLIRCLRKYPDQIHTQVIDFLHQKLSAGEKTNNIQTGIHSSALLTWKQIEEMEAHGISFGLHSRYHENMNFMSEEEISEMLKESKWLLYHKVKQPVPAFVYPGGNIPAQYESVRKILSDYDFKCALTDQFGIADVKTQDIYSLPRIGPPNKDIAFLEKEFYSAYNYFYNTQKQRT